MEKEIIVILKDRGIISVTGKDSHDFLQNILSNDINKVSKTSSIFSAIFTPQGKYLYEFFVIKHEDSYILDCDKEFIEEILVYLNKYKLNSEVKIALPDTEYLIGVIGYEKFQEIQVSEKKFDQTLYYQENLIFTDLRNQKLGARVISNYEKLNKLIKNLKLKITDEEIYLKKAYLNGIPIKGVRNLMDQLFGLEANFEELKAIDFKKGCYIGQENTARMKLKNKIRRKLLPIKAEKDFIIGSEITYNNDLIGKILISRPYPFALIKLFDPDFTVFKDKNLLINDNKIKIIS